MYVIYHISMGFMCRNEQKGIYYCNNLKEDTFRCDSLEGADLLCDMDEMPVKVEDVQGELEVVALYGQFLEYRRSRRKCHD